MKIFTNKIFESKTAEAIIFDSTIDYIDSTIYMRNDVDHMVNIPSNQIIVVDTATGQIKTIHR